MYSDDAEQAVLGAIMTEPQVLRVVRPILEPGDFAAGDAAETYAAILKLADRGDAIDPVTLGAELERGARDAAEADAMREYVYGLQHSVPSAANVEYHAGLVLHHAKRRAMLQRFEGASALLRQDTRPPGDVAAELRSVLDSVVEAEPNLQRAQCALTMPPAEPIRWLVEGFWFAGEIGFLVGDDGSYKSTVAVHYAGAVAGGYRVFDRFPVSQRRPVLYLSAEDPANVLQLRLEAFIQGHGWNRGRVLENVHFIYDPEASLADAKWRSHLLSEVERIGAGLVILDPLADLLGGDENSNSESRSVNRFLRRLTRVADTAVQVVHHMGKKSEGKREVDRIRGASALRGASRCTYAFEAVKGGIAVENLKLSRAQKHSPFVIERVIESEQGNRALWRYARFTYQSARDSARSRGELFILGQLGLRHPQRLNSSQLKALAHGTGVSGQDMSIGINTLSAKGLIESDRGLNQSKLWGLTDRGIVDAAPAVAEENARARAEAREGLPLPMVRTVPTVPTVPAVSRAPSGAELSLPEDSTESGPFEVAGLAERLPGKRSEAASGPALPVREAGRPGADAAQPGRAGNPASRESGNHSPNGTLPESHPSRRSRE